MLGFLSLHSFVVRLTESACYVSLHTRYRPFQSLIEDVRLDYKDEIVIFFKDNLSHLNDIDEVVTLLSPTEVTLEILERHISEEKMEILGYSHMDGSLAANSVIADEIRTAVYAIDSAQMRSFLGTCNVYRRFETDFFRNGWPLNTYLQKNMALKWLHRTMDALDAFETLTIGFMEPPILAFLQWHRTYVLDTNASPCEFGAVVLQQQKTAI